MKKYGSWLSGLLKSVSIGDLVGAILNRTSGRLEALKAVLRTLYPGRSASYIATAATNADVQLTAVKGARSGAMALAVGPVRFALPAAWKRFGWTLLWGSAAMAITYVSGHLNDLAGSLATQLWWIVALPLITAGLAAVSKYISAKQAEDIANAPR
jgi:hypothetical protein